MFICSLIILMWSPIIVICSGAISNRHGFFHCHEPMHMEGGTIALVAIR